MLAAAPSGLVVTCLLRVRHRVLIKGRGSSCTCCLSVPWTGQEAGLPHLLSVGAFAVLSAQGADSPRCVTAQPGTVMCHLRRTSLRRQVVRASRLCVPRIAPRGWSHGSGSERRNRRCEGLAALGRPVRLVLLCVGVLGRSATVRVELPQLLHLAFGAVWLARVVQAQCGRPPVRDDDDDTTTNGDAAACCLAGSIGSLHPAALLQ